MAGTLKIFLIILGLGILILPKQIIFAQGPVECCIAKSDKSDDCLVKTDQSCHSDQSTNSDQNDCKNDCITCDSCTVHFVVNYLSPELDDHFGQHFYGETLEYNYGISYFSSSFHNIWQPPKIG